MMSLKVLKDNRDALLLAEVAAWLHDMGKCADEHIINQASDKPQGYCYSYKKAQSHLLPSQVSDVCLINEKISVKDLIEEGRPRIISDTSRPWLLRVLGRCHSAAHVEKELSDSDTSTKQLQANTRLSTAFGLEGNPIVGLTSTLAKLPFHSMCDRATFVPQVERSFDTALGDTRRPVNEVTLSDWSGAVAALYKSALSGALLGIKPANPDDLRWRLLRVNFDVLALYAKAIKVADLLGYQNVVDKACETVKQLVEEEYPLGNEIYRDSTGIYFTFPDLDLPADLAQEIRHRVESVEMELAPRIAVTVGDGTTATDQLKSILGKARKEALEALAQPFDSQQLSACWQQQWKTADDGKWEVCPVCRLRPMGEGKEACETCLQRRVSRIETWKSDPAQTIWIDEIADHNDRVALIVGRFGLDDWLSGDLVQTMLVKAVRGNPNDCIPKNPSPARLRRVWETCQRFWTETVEREILARHHCYGAQNPSLRCARLLLTPDKTSGWREDVPYDGAVDGRAISLLWRKDGQQFITISNLELAGDIQPGQTIFVSEPDRPQQISFVVQSKAQATGKMGAYTPCLRLLASPDQFLALVPAAAALEIAKNIRQEYQKQFGKVQNRLPLFLGLVFFQRKISLTAVMDTARRMLASEFANGEWRITDAPQNNGKMVTLSLEQNGQCVTLQVPIVMGDGTTPDNWYPYFFFSGTPSHAQHYFQHNGNCLVHVNDLKQGDEIEITPSRFTYLFLENTARRFRFDPERDVMLLDELPRLMKMWDDLKSSGITDTGLRNVQALLERKGEIWGRKSKEFEHLAHTTLKEAGLFKRKDQNGNSLPDVVTPQDVVSGRFARCLELHLYILKLKIKESQGGVPT
jgi:hypothetical protein